MMIKFLSFPPRSSFSFFLSREKKNSQTGLSPSYRVRLILLPSLCCAASFSFLPFSFPLSLVCGRVALCSDNFGGGEGKEGGRFDRRRRAPDSPFPPLFFPPPLIFLLPFRRVLEWRELSARLGLGHNRPIPTSGLRSRERRVDIVPRVEFHPRKIFSPSDQLAHLLQSPNSSRDSRDLV